MKKELTEEQKQKYRETAKIYYRKHKKVILAQHRARYQAKKAVKDAMKIWQPTMPPMVLKPNIQEMHIQDFYSEQLARIEKALWWIAFAISFVGIAILFK